MKYLRAVVNILLFISIPIWGGLAIWFCYLIDRGCRKDLSEAFKGKRWLIE